MHPFIEYVNPELGELLTNIGLDKRYVRGDGCYLYDEDGKTYLDMIAAYGALPFGFNPPEIWEAIHQVEATGEPSFVQPSLLTPAGELARALLAIAPQGMGKVTFANSGAEAVEAAIKLARSKTGKRGIVAAHNSFHGKTLGALSATGNNGYQQAFGAPVAGFRFVPYGDIDALRQVLMSEASDIAAVILEPIQGEGGIVEPPEGYLRAVRDLCTEYDVLLILDEIQTGLGRTGTMFACESEQVTPDIMTVAKALGGGLVPIGAVICTDAVYNAEFAMKHSSTFAGNTIACRVALAAIKKLTSDNNFLVREAARKGELLKQGLLAIQAKYPQVIKAIRGRGLMLGIDFGNSRAPYPNSMLGILAEQKLLTPMIASHLLNVGGVRVAPTLNGASVVRIEPPLVISDQQIAFALTAIENTVRELANGNTAAFLGHLINVSVDKQYQSKRTSSQVQQLGPEKDAGRFAFLVHPLSVRNYAEYDQSLAVFTEEQLCDLTSRWSDMLEPYVIATSRIVSNTGKIAYGDFIVVPYTAKELQQMPKETAEKKIIAAIELAQSRGARIVGLGAYTSVVTAGGRSLLRSVSVPITTGNSYTVLSGVEALLIAGSKLGIDMHQATAAVVGAGGAIGKASALLLSEHVSRLILIGNPDRPEKSYARMRRIIAEMYRYIARLGQQGKKFTEGSFGAYVSSLTNLPHPEAGLEAWMEVVQRENELGRCPVMVTVDLRRYLPEADLILSATSSTEALITADILSPGAIICDMSRPGNVAKDVLERREDVLVIDGGVIELPGRPDLGWNFGFDQGLAYACMSETIMLALEHLYENASIGADLNIDFMNELKVYAQNHGFKLAGFRSFDQPLAPDVWERVVAARQYVAKVQGA